MARRLTKGKERDEWKATLTLYRLVVHARALWTTGTLELGVDRSEAFAVADAVADGDLSPVHRLADEAGDLFASPTVLSVDDAPAVALARDILAQVRQTTELGGAR